MRYLLFLVLLTVISCQSKYPNIELEPNIYLGKVKNGVPIDFFVKCKNNGNTDVILHEVNVSCSCIQAIGKNPSKIQAHDSCVFHFQLLPEGMGYIERTLELYFKGFPESSLIQIGARVTN